MTKEQLKLGCTVRDSITGYEGVVVCITEWINGCVRGGVQAKQLYDGKPVEAQYFDVQQLELVSEAPKQKAPPAGGDRPNPRRAPDPR